MLKFITISILSCLMGSCAFTDKNCRNVTLEKKVNNLIKKSDDLNIIKLDTVNSIDWNELLIIKPYSPLDDIENSQKVTLKCVGESIQHYDNIVTICFLKEKECISYIELLKNFELEDQEKTLYEKEDAMIKIKMQ